MCHRKRAALIVLAAVLTTSQPLLAQEPVDREMFARIRAEGTEHSRVWEAYGYLVDEVGPRLTGTPAFLKAAEWARGRFAAFGLSDARLEAWPFGRGWTLEGFSLDMSGPRYMPLIGYPRAWSPPTPGRVTGTPVMLGDVRSTEELESYRDRVAGAIVLTAPIETRFILTDREQPEPIPPAGYAPTEGEQGSLRRAVARMLQEEGAAVSLAPSRGAHGTMFVLGRDGGDDAVPSVVVAAEHYNMIARMLARGMDVELAVEVAARFHEEDTSGYNVLAEIPGIDPDIGHEIVMVGGHLDSWHAAPGATDNADHCATIIEVARILSALEVRPRRTIRFALWGGEEEGLLGARAWVAEHLEGDANADARDAFSVYFNLDPGAGPVYGFFLEENEAVVPFFNAVLDEFADLGADRSTLDPIGSTDHVPFKRLGLPAFTSIDDYVDYDVRTHHTNMDTYERIREEDLRQAAIVTAALVYTAAMRDERIPRKAPGGSPVP
jgi:hypothetical protein